LNLVVEFKEKVLEPEKTLIRSYRTHDAVLLELRHHKLLVHPPIEYYVCDELLNIGLAPFIKTDDDEGFSLYSIALEGNSVNKSSSIPRCTTCKFVILNPTAVLVIDSVTGKILRALEASPDGTLSSIDVHDYNIYSKTVHPLRDSAVVLTKGDEVLKLTINNSNIAIENIRKCRDHVVGKGKFHTTLLCLEEDPYVITSSNVYGFDSLLDLGFDFRNSDNTVFTKDIDGYLINNIHFVEINSRCYIKRLDSKTHYDEWYTVERFRPLAFMNNSKIAGLFLDTNALALLEVSKRHTHAESIAKIDPNHLLEVQVDVENNTIVLTYSNYVYVFNVTDEPVFVRIRPEDDAYSALIAYDKLLVFCKKGIYVYEIDVSSRQIYAEKMLYMPKYLMRCTKLVKDKLFCIDKLGRIIVAQLDELTSSIIPTVRPLRDSLGVSIYVNDLTSWYTTMPVYENRVTRIMSHHHVLSLGAENYLDQLVLFRYRGFSTNRFVNRKVTVNELERLRDIHIVILGSKIMPIIPNPSLLPYKNVYVACVNGTDIVNASSHHSLPYSDTRSPENPKTCKDLRLFLVGIKDFIEWGLSIDKSKIVSTNNTVLTINGSKICLVNKTSNTLSTLGPTILMAICSNGIVKGSEHCLDLNSCKRLLKILLELSNFKTVLPLPIENIVNMKRTSIDNADTVSLTYMQGTPQILMPRKCVDVAQAIISIDKLRPLISLVVRNRCKNVGATIIAGTNVVFLGPDKVVNISTPLDVDEIISDQGFRITIFESTGTAETFVIPTSLSQIMLMAVSIALKIAKIMGARNNVVKAISDIHQGF